MKIAECNRNCSSIARDVLKETMTWFHTYYAVSCIEAGICRTVVVYEDGVAGVGLFYLVPRLNTGVIYYVSVLPRHRGRGIGKAIVVSIEEILGYEGVEVFIATTRRDNVASRRMLRDLGYTEIELKDLGSDLEELVTMMTCGYEDDLLYIKPGGIDVASFFNKALEPSLFSVVEGLWRSICYRPWRKLRSL